MNLYFRFLWLLLRQHFVKKPIDIFSSATTSFRVNLLDLDLNAHMNNGRYFSIMDLGRFDLMLKANTFWALLAKGYLPVVTSQSIRFKKSLGILQKFDVTTRIEAWDERDLYILQTFSRNNEVYAEGIVKARFIKKGKGSISTKELFESIGLKFQQSDASEYMTAQRKIESLLSQQT